MTTKRKMLFFCFSITITIAVVIVIKALMVHLHYSMQKTMVLVLRYLGCYLEKNIYIVIHLSPEKNLRTKFNQTVNTSMVWGPEF